jgi:polysaccharide export outer membrane protein
MTKIAIASHATALLLILFSQILRADDAVETTEKYRIQPGDVLEISVWKDENMLKVVQVRPDGEISLPLANEIQAQGKTVAELRENIIERLKKFIPDPVVGVSTQVLTGNKVYVIGNVSRPGEIVANTYLDVLQALSVAGGMSPFASVNKIKVLRRENGQLISIPFRYGDIEKGKELEQNIILKGGDVVLVP